MCFFEGEPFADLGRALAADEPRGGGPADEARRVSQDGLVGQPVFDERREQPTAAFDEERGDLTPAELGQNVREVPRFFPAAGNDDIDAARFEGASLRGRGGASGENDDAATRERR